MSEIKVNKVSPRTNCGTVQLGDSGDTITIPAGATITNAGTANGFGATGAVNWQTTVKTSGFTASAGEGYFVDTTSGPISVNLPAGTAGAIVGIADYAENFDTNKVTLVQNGSDKIAGLTVNGSLQTKGLAASLVFVDSTKGWIVTDSGLAGDVTTAQFVAATGGTESTDGDFKIHVFTGPGTFQVTDAGGASGSNTVDYMVVGAGGAGGSGGTQAGGGGAGGFRISPGTASGTWCASPRGAAPAAAVPVSVQSYPVVVGAGGAAQSQPNRGNSGNVSSIFCIQSAGGGGGGVRNPSNKNGLAGGSGGGAGNGPGGCGGAGNTPPVNPVQGTPGGNAGPSSGNYAGGSGGGALVNGTGGPDASQDGGAGAGVGIIGCSPAKPTTGTTGPDSALRYFAGGGGSQRYPATAPTGIGGVGGGGNGGCGPASPAPPNPGLYPNGECGTANTGGGGGGSEYRGGGGGSGIVVIRYKFQ